MKETQLHSYHLKHGKMAEFAGYDLPLWYTTTTEEHMAVRNATGIFDVSHMGRFEVDGKESTAFLEGLVPTKVEAQPVGKAFYTLLLNERGGIIDDLIIERLGETEYMVVVNAANREVDLAHMRALASSKDAFIDDVTDSSAMIAVQGPSAQAALQPLVEADLGTLKRFRAQRTKALGHPALVSRTGYTGEDGFEVIVMGPTNEEPSAALEVWERLANPAKPCGLGARDSLRLEAGLPLHGTDMDKGTDPFQADLGWVLTKGKGGYFGAEAVSELMSSPPKTVRRGVVLDQGIPRHGFKVADGTAQVGTVTSGTYSPILRKGIAMGMLEGTSSEPGKEVQVEVRGAMQRGNVVKPPFYDPQVYGWNRRSNGK